MNARRFAFGVWTLAAVIGTAAALANLTGLRLNTSASAPAGLWRVGPLDPQRLGRGMLVSVCPPPLGIVATMRKRGYLPPGDCPGVDTAPLLKPVIAVAGDTVTVASGEPLAVNGLMLPGSLPVAGMPAWPPGTYRVLPGELWLLSRYDAASFDSRYFGPVSVMALRGQAEPVLVRGEVRLMTAGVYP